MYDFPFDGINNIHLMALIMSALSVYEILSQNVHDLDFDL